MGNKKFDLFEIKIGGKYKINTPILLYSYTLILLYSYTCIELLSFLRLRRHISQRNPDLNTDTGSCHRRRA